MCRGVCEPTLTTILQYSLWNISSTRILLTLYVYCTVLCMMREQGILPDDTAYFLSGEFDFGVNSHHTTATLSCLKNKLTVEMFEKCIELSSKYAVHGLCAISKGVYMCNVCECIACMLYIQ